MPEYYLGGDFHTTAMHVKGKSTNTKLNILKTIPSSGSGEKIDSGEIAEIGPRDVAEVDHDEKTKHLSVLWLKQGVKTAFSAETYISRSIDRLQQIVGKEFPKKKTQMEETTHP